MEPLEPPLDPPLLCLCNGTKSDMTTISPVLKETNGMLTIVALHQGGGDVHPDKDIKLATTMPLCSMNFKTAFLGRIASMLT